MGRTIFSSTHLLLEEEKDVAVIVMVGIELAKCVFAVNGIDEGGKRAMVRLMAAQFVAPYRMSGKRGKNDAADAATICEATTVHRKAPTPGGFARLVQHRGGRHAQRVGPFG